MTTNTMEMAELRATWDADPNAIHKRPPFRAHSFDNDHRFWVVGSTCVSVLHGWYGAHADAERLAAVLNGDTALSETGK
jgi:hypothetical protein